MQTHGRSQFSFLSRYLQPPRIVRRFRREEDGTTAIEFAMLAAPFFVLLFGIIECSLIFFAGQMLESAADSVGRRIRTGQLDNSLTADQFRTEMCNEAAVLFNCDDIHVDLRTAATFSDLDDPPLPSEDDNSTNFDEYTFESPCPEEIVMVTASYEWPIFTYFVSDNIYRSVEGSSGNAAFRKILLNAIAVFRTEPFPADPGGASCA